MSIQPTTILKLSHIKALNFFLKHESYFSSDMPPYFNFTPLLKAIKKELSDTPLSDIMSETKVWNCEKVNHSVLMNKDGKLSWRPLQLIHPVLYVNLAREITRKDNWEKIKKRFYTFMKNPNILCLSIPTVAPENKKDRAAQVLKWWQQVELKSIELALEYEYLYETDISDCYSSIYTHSIAWAVETKSIAKNNRDTKLLGNFIDRSIQHMQYNQTNGIPQGSTLMDFIAEIVLGYVDEKLSNKLNDSGISDYKILRYRDDYRIFVNNPPEGEQILKYLAEILTNMGLKLNSSKTKFSNDVVFSSVKLDKQEWITSHKHDKDLIKQCLIIKQHSLKHPNSGSLTTALSNFNQRIVKLNRINDNHSAIISMITDIAYRNPRVYPVCFAIISKFLSLIKNNKTRKETIKMIYDKFSSLPHVGYMEIWFQRAIKSNMEQIKFKESLCNIVTERKIELWNSKWINSKNIKEIMSSNFIFNKEKFEQLDDVIGSLEFDLFPKVSG